MVHEEKKKDAAKRMCLFDAPFAHNTGSRAAVAFVIRIPYGYMGAKRVSGTGFYRRKWVYQLEAYA